MEPSSALQHCQEFGFGIFFFCGLGVPTTRVECTALQLQSWNPDIRVVNRQSLPYCRFRRVSQVVRCGGAYWVKRRLTE